MLAQAGKHGRVPAPVVLVPAQGGPWLRHPGDSSTYRPGAGSSGGCAVAAERPRRGAARPGVAREPRSPVRPPAAGMRSLRAREPVVGAVRQVADWSSSCAVPGRRVDHARRCARRRPGRTSCRRPGAASSRTPSATARCGRRARRRYRQASSRAPDRSVRPPSSARRRLAELVVEVQFLRYSRTSGPAGSPSRRSSAAGRTPAASRPSGSC